MIRKIRNLFIFGFSLCIIMTVVSYYYVRDKAKPYLYSDVNSIPKNKVGLLLGTSPYLGNLYFRYRIDAAVELFRNEKIRHILVSGDNHIEGYDEATAMKKALVAEGVPDSCITLDYAGFRTYDSILRSNKVFGQQEFTVISQEFHNERAVFIARAYGISAIGYNAGDVETSYGMKTMVREFFARVKCLIDIYILHTEPHFLGDKINLNV